MEKFSGGRGTPFTSGEEIVRQGNRGHESGSSHVLPRCGLREAPRTCGGLRWSRNGFWSFCENELEQTEKITDLRARDYEGWQQTQSKVVGAIDEQALTESSGDEGIAVGGAFDAA